MNNQYFFYNGPLLTMDGGEDVLPCGWLHVCGGKVAGYGAYQPGATSLPAGAEAIDLKGRLLMPGLVNTHTHAAMTIFRGLADDLPLMEWLNNYIFPVEKNLTSEWVRIGTELACVEMIRSGTTAAADMYLFEQSALEAFERAGMRALCGEAAYDFPSPNYGAPEEGLKYMAALAERWAGHPLLKVGVTPHAPYTCSPELLRKLAELARKNGVRLHIHVAETEFEVAQVRERYGRHPLCHLDNLGVVDENLIAAHMVWLGEDEIDLAARRGVKVAHCPESNLKLGSGFAPVPAMLKAGVVVGLGTDGCASNNNLDMFVEMDYAAKLHKGVLRDPTVATDREVLRMATIDGAKVLGVDDVTGSLAVGKSADLILVDFTAAHLRPVYDYISHLVYAVGGSDVTDTMVAGRWLMRDRKVLSLDEASVFEGVEGIAQEIRRIVKK